MGGAASLLGPRDPIPSQALVLQAVYPDLRHAIRARLASRLGTVLATIGEPLLSHQTWPRIGTDPDAISPARALGEYPGPVLVVAGREDRSTPLVDSERLHAAAGRRATLWIIPHGDHSAISGLETPAYWQRLLAFFRAALGDPLTALPPAPHRSSDGRSPPHP